MSTVATSALADYVCVAVYTPPTSAALGAHGYVTATFTGGPNCSGPYNGSRLYCTAGATFFACARDYVYSADAVLTLFSALQRAALDDQLVAQGTTTCLDGSVTCGSYVYFYNN
jgi:hypothetical protein